MGGRVVEMTWRLSCKKKKERERKLGAIFRSYQLRFLNLKKYKVLKCLLVYLFYAGEFGVSHAPTPRVSDAGNTLYYPSVEGLEHCSVEQVSLLSLSLSQAS